MSASYFQCSQCGTISYSAYDQSTGYCGICYKHTGDNHKFCQDHLDLWQDDCPRCNSNCIHHYGVPFKDWQRPKMKLFHIPEGIDNPMGEIQKIFDGESDLPYTEFDAKDVEESQTHIFIKKEGLDAEIDRN